MRAAYLCVETHSDQPDKIRLLLCEVEPSDRSEPDNRGQIRFCAHFNDGDAALMHTHDLLRRRLVDIDNHLYQATIEEAIAAIDSVELRHQVTFTDPALSDGSRHIIDASERDIRRRQARRNRFFEVAGYIGLGLLLFNMFFLAG